MALSPKDMDFIEAKNAASREIALAFGVPPMLLGIPGDNTYANYQEANRAFYRLTVLPLVGRIAKELSAWLAPAYGEELRLWYDADRVEGLADEREALWARLGAAGFLSPTTRSARRSATAHPAGERLMAVLTEAGWIWAAKGAGAMAGSAISLAYLLPRGRREAASRALPAALVSGLVFGGTAGLKIAAGCSACRT